MKIKDLFEAKGKSLVGLTIKGKTLPVEGEWKGDFGCRSLHLTSLEGAPSSVERNFDCYGNKLTSLKGAPSSVGGDFYCPTNRLTDLKYSATFVGGGFYCSDNQLTSLQGAPSSVGGNFYCYNNQLTSLEGAPSSVGGNFWCSYNQLSSLKDVHKHIKRIDGKFYCAENPIKSHVLGLLLIDGLTAVRCHEVWADILNQAIEQFDDKRKRVMWAQSELVKQLGEEGKALAQL